MASLSAWVPAAADRQFGAEPWITVPLTWMLGGEEDRIELCFREAAPEETWVELAFSDFCWGALHGAGQESGAPELDEVVKAELLRLFLGVSQTLGAVGFACRLVDEGAIVGPPAIDRLRALVLGAPSPDDTGAGIVVAGLATSQAGEVAIGPDRGDSRLRYRMGGFQVVDALPPEASKPRPAVHPEANDKITALLRSEATRAT